MSSPAAEMLDREEYVEQAYFFRVLAERMRQSMTTQDLLMTVKEELLSTARLNLAIDFLAAELRHRGVMADAMGQLSHYFTAFQTFLIRQAEDERGRFDFGTALAILEREAKHRAEGAAPQAAFLYQLECLCRNRLSYDEGLTAMAHDPIYDAAWQEWIFTVRRQIGIVDLTDLLYVRSAYYLKRQRLARGNDYQPEKEMLFEEKEGRIALANRGKDPLFLFSALERQLGYPAVPRPKRVDEKPELIPQLLRRVERLESRIKLLEEEQKGGIDIEKFYGKAAAPSVELNSFQADPPRSPDG